LWVLS